MKRGRINSAAIPATHNILRERKFRGIVLCNSGNTFTGAVAPYRGKIEGKV